MISSTFLISLLLFVVFSSDSLECISFPELFVGSSSLSLFLVDFDLFSEICMLIFVVFGSDSLESVKFPSGSSSLSLFLVDFDFCSEICTTLR